MKRHGKKCTEPVTKQVNSCGSIHFDLLSAESPHKNRTKRRSRRRTKNKRNKRRESTEESANMICFSSIFKEIDWLSEKGYIVNPLCKGSSLTFFIPIGDYPGVVKEMPKRFQKYSNSTNEKESMSLVDSCNLQYEYIMEWSHSSQDDDDVIFCESSTLSSDFEICYETSSVSQSRDTDSDNSDEEYTFIVSDDDDDDDDNDFICFESTDEYDCSSVTNSYNNSRNTPQMSFENTIASYSIKIPLLSESSHQPKRKQVTFKESTELTTVHKIIAWGYAYRAARVGTWEMMSRDASRFRKRIERVEPTLSAVLSSAHRSKILANRMSMSA